MKIIKRIFKKYAKIANKRVTVAMLPFLLILSVIGILSIGFKKAIIIIGVLLICSLIIDFFKNRKKGKKFTKKKKKKIVKIIFNSFLVFVILVIVSGITFVVYVITTAPKFEPNTLYKKEASIVYDINGKVVAKLGLEIRDKITFDDVPEVLIDAILATEDARYYQHNGFDLPRFLKAATGQVMGNSDAGGASTITMQVVKNNITDTKVSLTRKFTDIYMSIFVLERKYSKEQIFEFYINAPYLGNRSYGVAEAAKNYFGKEVKDINLSEAAFIAGLFQSPSYYGDYAWSKPERIESRRNTVLYLMRRHGYITKDEETIAKSIPISSLLKSKTVGLNKYQSFIDIVINEVEEKTGYSPYTMPMKIYSTLDTVRQDAINEIVDGGKFTWPNEKTQTGMAVTNVHTGALVAICGGRNIEVERGFNRATDITRQPGSTAKPLFDYGPGIEYENWSTYTPFLDAPHAYSNGISIKNWDERFMGLLTLKQALGLSRNIPALKAFQAIDNKLILNFVTSLGLKPEVKDGYIHEAHSIGAYNGSNPVELAAAYSAFANGGYYIKPYTVTKIVYTESDEEEIFTPIKNKVMKDTTASMITSILKWAVTDGISRTTGYVPGYDTAVKTGTSNYDYKFVKTWNLKSPINDLWSVGYSPDYSLAVWYGYDKITSESSKNKWYNTSADTSRKHRLFNMVLREIVKDSTKKFTFSKNIVSVTIEKNSIPPQLPSAFTPENMKITEYFSKGTEPTTISPRYQQLENAKNLNVNITGNKINLSWTPSPTPLYYTEDFMLQHFETYYGSNSSSYLNKHKAEIEAEMGVIGYDVYYKGEDNVEHFIASTTNNSIQIDKPNIQGNLILLVKTAFSKFKPNSSPGVSYSFLNEIISPIASYSPNVVKSIGSPEIGLKDLISINNNGIDVTNESTITYNLVKAPMFPSEFPIKTNAVATYNIEYTITYKGISVRDLEGNKIKQTIEIK